MIPPPETIGVFVRLNVAEVAPGTDAVTVNGPPAVPFAVTVVLIIPAPFVDTLVVTILAPLAGPENVTAAPLTGLPAASFTMTDTGTANAVFTCALCPPPPVAVTVAAGPAMLVSK
jgi:hypothetical protein